MGFPLPDQYISEGEWEGVQRNFDALAALVLDTGGRSLGIRVGAGALTWPGGSAFTNTLTVAHGLGRAPVSVAATATLAAGTDPCVVHVVSLDATNVQFRGHDTAGLSPAAATSKAFYWLAIG